jgi:putative inorganic carbon (HCO3(-)) transporter
MKKISIDVYLINALLFLLPLFYISGFLSYDSSRYFLFGTTSLILTIFTTYRFVKNKWLFQSFFKSWYCYGLIAYIVSFLIVSIFSINPALSFFSSFQRIDGFFTILFLSLFSLSIYSISSIYKQRVVKQFLISSVLGAVILSIFILLSPDGLSFLNWKWLVESRGGAMTGNSSVAAAYTLWNIFFAVILFVKSENLKKKILWILPLLILVLSPLFINWHILLGQVKYTGIISLIGTARGALVGIIFGSIVVCGVYFSLQIDKVKKYVGISLISIIAVVTILSGVSLFQQDSILHQKFIENVGENRFIFWNSAMKGFEEHPFLGAGPNTFSYSFHKFFNSKLLLQDVGEVMVDKTHNIFFETLVGGGILLIMGLLFFLFSIIAGLMKLGKNNHLSILETSLFIGALLGWLFQAQFVFDSTVSLAMLFLVGGIVYGSLVNKPEIKKQKIIYLSTKDKFIIFVFSVVAIVLFIYTIVLPCKKSSTMDKIYNTNLPLRASLWKNLEGISPMGDSSDSVIMFDNIFKTYDREKQNIRAWDDYKKDVILKELDAIIDHLTTVNNKVDDYELILIHTKISYVRMYIAKDVGGDLFDKTKNLIERAISLSPADPQPYWVLVQIRTASGDLIGAKDSLEKAFILEPKSTYTNKMILLLAKSINDEEYYNFALKRAVENIPNFKL